MAVSLGQKQSKYLTTCHRQAFLLRLVSLLSDVFAHRRAFEFTGGHKAGVLCSSSQMINPSASQCLPEHIPSNTPNTTSRQTPQNQQQSQCVLFQHIRFYCKTLTMCLTLHRDFMGFRCTDLNLVPKVLSKQNLTQYFIEVLLFLRGKKHTTIRIQGRPMFRTQDFSFPLLCPLHI